MLSVIKPEEKRLYYVYFVVMGLLFFDIEPLQLTRFEALTDLLKTIPALLTAALAIVSAVRNGVPGRRNRLLFVSILMIGVADILLCFFTGVVPIMSDIPGFAAFCAAEILIALWMGLDGKSILLYILTIAVMILVGVLAHRISLYTVTALTNLGLVLGNLIRAALRHRRQKSRTSLLYVASAADIAICDYSILLRTVLSADLPRTLAYEAVWIGYLPFLALLLLTFRSSCRDAQG